MVTRRIFLLATVIFGSGAMNSIWGGSNWSDLALSATTTSGFSVPLNVSNNAGASYSPSLAVEASGKVHIIWSDNTGLPTGETFYAAKDADAVAFSPPNRISSLGSSQPSVALDTNGGIHVIWAASSGSAADIFYKTKLPNDEDFSGPTNVSNTTTPSYAPSLFVDAAGTVHVIWTESLDRDTNLLYSQKAPSATQFSQALTVARNAGFSDSGRPTIAVDNLGTVTVVFSQFGEIVFSSKLATSDSFPIANYVANTPDPSNSPVIVLDSNNGLHVAWRDETTSGVSIFYAVKGAGSGTFSQPQQAAANTGAVELRLAVANGTVNIIWRAQDIHYVSKSSGGSAFSVPQNISNTGNVFGQNPALGAGRDGSVHIAWGDGNQTPDILYTTKSGEPPSRNLSFTNQRIPHVATGIAFGIAPTVDVIENGSRLTSDNTTRITIRVKAGTGASGVTLSCDGGTQKRVVAGQAVFTNCKIDLLGQGYVLEAIADDVNASSTSTPSFAGVGAADINGDARVDIVDFSILLSQFGRSAR